MDNLKPCPFCGGSPEVKQSSGDERDGYADHIAYVCKGCGCRRGAAGQQNPKGGYAINDTVAQRAIEAWNRRFDADRQAQLEKDAERMEFLVQHIVEVREELRYGSRFMFVSQAQYGDEDEFLGTTLREQIDAAIAAKQQSGEKSNG